MCGIVQNPVSKGSLTFAGAYPNLDQYVVKQFEKNCADYHIPLAAAKFVMSLADNAIAPGGFGFQHVPLAIYADGARVTTSELAALEEDVMHLAMSGSLMHFLNEQLMDKHNIMILMSHCCGGDIIPTHTNYAMQQGLLSSHELNKFRGDKIKTLSVTDTVLVDWNQFVRHISDFAKSVYYDMDQVTLPTAA
jgi:hypothetical protein